MLPFEADPGEADAWRGGSRRRRRPAGGPGADPAEGEFPDEAWPDRAGPDGDLAGAGLLLALARYAMAEETVAEGLQRLAALAEPLDEPGRTPARTR